MTMMLLLLLFRWRTVVALTGAPSDHQCAVEWNPSVTGWKSGQGHCQELGGRLCTRHEYCPGGSNTIPTNGLINTNNHQRQWAPTSDGINTWVLLTNFTNNNGHLGVILEAQHDTGNVTGPVCIHDDLSQSLVEWTSLTSGPQDIIVTCCNQDGSVDTLAPCQSAATFKMAADHCANNGLRLCTNTELQQNRLHGLTAIRDLGGDGCTDAAACAKCAGDCDTDVQCQGSLICHQRLGVRGGGEVDGTATNAVPGCQTAGVQATASSSAVNDHDYCSSCYIGDGLKKRTWTSTPCTTSTLPAQASNDKPMEHADQPCTLSSDIPSTSSTSFDQIGKTIDYAILSVAPSETASAATNMIDDSNPASYWEPGIDVGGEFVLDVGQVGLSATHLRLATTTTATSFSIAVYSSYRENGVRTPRSNLTITPTQRIYALNDAGIGYDSNSPNKVSMLPVFTALDPGHRYYWIYVSGKTGSGTVRINSISLMSKSSANPSWGMTDALGRSFLGNVKCCDVPTKKATKVSTSNHGGGGEGVGGWSCAVNDDNFLRVDTYVETAYHTTTCNGVECATNKIYTEMECANYCGILHSSTSAATDASFFHFKRHTTNNGAPICTCMVNIPTDATDAYGSDVLFVAGKSSSCVRTPYMSCAEAYEKGETESGTYYINGRTTYCDMETHGGGWELIGHAAGTGNWPTFDLNFDPSMSGSGSYEDKWDVSTANSYMRNYSHLLLNDVNNDVEMMFMTGDRSSWIVLRQIDVTKKQNSTSKLNAQVLGSSDSSGSPRGSWINVLMDPSVAADPKVGDTYWREDSSTVGLELKNAHKGIGVFVRNGIPRRCRITSGGGILSKNFEKKSSAGTLGRNGGGSTWPKGLLKLDSAASLATTCATTKTSTLIGQACQAVYKESTWQGTVATAELCEAAIAVVCTNKKFFVYADGIGNDGSGNGNKTCGCANDDTIATSCDGLTPTNWKANWEQGKVRWYSVSPIPTSVAVTSIIDSNVNTYWAICPLVSSSSVGSAIHYNQAEVEIDVNVAWTNGNERSLDYVDESLLNYNGAASPCIQGIDIVWSANQSASLYNILGSSDKVHYHPLVSDQNRNASADNIKHGCRTNTVHTDNSFGSEACIDHHDFSIYPYRAKYIRLQLLESGANIALHNSQQGVNPLRYELREIRVFGAVCEHDFQSGSTTSIVTVDIGESGQLTSAYPVGSGGAEGSGHVLPMSSGGSAGEDIVSPFLSGVLAVDTSKLISNATNALAILIDGGSVKTTNDRVLFSPNITSLNSGGAVVYGNNIDVVSTDGIVTTSGSILVTIQGLRQGHHAIGTRHHDPSSTRSSSSFNVYTPLQTKPLLQRIKSSYGSGNITQELDENSEHGHARVSMHVASDSASSTDAEDVALSYITNVDAGPQGASDVIELNGLHWSDDDGNGMANGWGVTTDVDGTVEGTILDLVGRKNEMYTNENDKWDDYTTFTGKYQQVSGRYTGSSTTSNFIVNITCNNAVVAGEAYSLSFYYMTNGTELQLFAGDMSLHANPSLWTSTALTAASSNGVHGFGSLNDAQDSDPSALVLNKIAYYHTTFRATSSGSIMLQMKAALATYPVGSVVVLRLDNFRLTPVYSGVGSRTTWQSASNRCQNRGLRLCSRNDYCPNGPGTNPIGGAFLTKQLTGSTTGIERWAPYISNVNNDQYTWIKLEAAVPDNAASLGQACNDQPPPGRYTCPEYFERGNCTAPWMNRHCCQSCFSCAGTCTEKQVGWTKVYSNGASYGSYDAGKDLTDRLFALSNEISSDYLGRIFARDCFDCASEAHRLIYYKRLTPVPRAFSIYDYMTSNFIEIDNQLNVDFDIYSSYEDAVSETNKWVFCGFGNSSTSIGFPGTCGPTAAPATAQWSSLGGGGVSNYAYYVRSAPPDVTCISNSSEVHTTGNFLQSGDRDMDEGTPNISVSVEITGDYMCCADSQSCDAPLGMESGAISDAQLSDTGASALSQKRLNIVVGSANGWIFPGPAGLLHPFGSSYYQVDLKKTYSVSSIGSQGRGDKNQWVTSYKVQYTAQKDGTSGWKYVSTRNAVTGAWSDHVFNGNNDRDTVVKNVFNSPVVARHVRVYPMGANSITAMRLEFYGGDVGRCAPSLVYGSKMMLKNLAFQKFLQVGSNGLPTFNSDDAGTNAQFYLRHAGGSSSISSEESVEAGQAISYGDHVVFQHVLTGLYLSYNMGSSSDANIALSSGGTTIAVSGSMDAASYPPALMIDNNYQFGWQSQTGHLSTITLDTKTLHVISQVSIHWNLVRAAIGYTILRSTDGSNWVTAQQQNNIACSNLRVDDILGWAEPTRYIQFQLNDACNAGSEDEDEPFFEILQLTVTGRVKDTSGSALHGNRSSTNVTYQILDGLTQATANSSADVCAPYIASGTPVRVASHHNAPTSNVLLRRMGTSTSLGCYLGVDDAGNFDSELLGNGHSQKTNRFEIHSVDSASKRLILNSIQISTNNTVPPQVRWLSSSPVTSIEFDRVTINWESISSLGGPKILGYNLSTVSIVHQITSIDLRTASDRGAADQFSISVHGSGITTSCLAWDATADQVKTAIIDSNVTGFYETQAIHVTRFTSDSEDYSYKWLITFVHDSPVNLTATYGESPCTAEASTGVQADVWMVVEEIRPRSITNLAEMRSIAPSSTTQLVTGLSGFSTYAFTISAFNVLGYSVSSLKLVTTTAIIQAPDAIGVAPTLNTPSAVQLTEEWGDHPRNGGYSITGYYISCQHNTSVDISHVKEVVAFHQELSIAISDDSSATGNERAKIATIDGEVGSDGDIDHANLTSLVATDGSNQLHTDVVLSFEVKTTDVVYTPFSFQHTSKTVTDTGLFMDLIAPGVGWRQNTWQRYQTRIPSSAYANVANIDWSDLGKIIIRRSGVVTGTADETPGGAVLSFRNWKYTAGIQNIETFDLSTTPALGTVVGLEGETTYVMKVAAYNVAGVAAWSPLSAGTATTVPQVPSKAENAPLITFGRTTNDADSFLITWELPYFGGTPITGYKLLMLSRLAQVQLITLNTTVSSLVAGTSGGEFKITIGSTSTPCLAWDASAATVQNALLTSVFQVLTNDHHQPSIEKVSKSQLEMINDEKYIDYSFSRWRIVFGADASVVPLLVASNSGCAAFNDATGVAPAVDIIVTEFQTGNQSASSIITEDTGSVERSLTMTNMLGDSVYSVQFHAINARGPGEYSDLSLNYTTPKATTPVAVNTVNSTLLSNVSASIAWNDFRAMGSPVTNYAVGSKYVTNEIQRLHVRVNVTDNNHIEGNFSLRWKDKLTACIPVDVSASKLQSVLISDFQWSNIGLEVTRTNHSYSTHNDASYDLKFTNWVGGDVPNVDSGASSTYARVRQWGSTSEVHDVAFEQNDVEKPLSCGQILEVYSTKGNSTFSSLGYVAVKSNGQVVSWGSSQGGAMATLSSSLNNGAKQIASTTTAFAVLKYDGSIVSFGNPLSDDGADSSQLAADLLVRKLYSNNHAFVAIGIDGTPTCWGRMSSGGDCSSVNATHVDVIVASSTAFCSLSVLGIVNCWGDPLTGGNQTEVTTLFSDNARVASLHANRHAFVAVMSDTYTIRCWGNSLYGGKCAPSDNMDPTFLLATTPVQQVVGTATAFAAVSKENGRVYTWGDSANGGDVGVGGTGHDNMTSILKLVSNAYSFAALDTAGNVLTWGNAAYDVVSTTSDSGTTVTDALTSSSIVDIVGSNAMDFDGKTLCALKKNPSGNFKAYCWGEVVSGGNTIVDDIRGVVLNTGAMAAWKTDGTVHAFGNNAYGASIPVDVTGDAFHHSIGHVVASYNGFVAMYNSSTVLSTISSETTNSSISDLQCTGCVPPSSGVCKDIYGICTNRCTNAGVQKGSSKILTMCRNSNSRRDNNAMSQMTVEEIRRGRNGPLLNGNFESDQYNGYRGHTYAAPEYWRGGSNGRRGGPMVVTSGAPNDGVHPSTILNTTAQGLQQYVMLVYPGSWIEQDLLRLPDVGSAVGISFDVARIGTCGNSTTGTALHRLDVVVSSGDAEVQSIVNSRDEYKHLNLSSVLDLSTASDTFMRYTTKFYVPASLGDRAVTLRFINVGTPSPLSEECTLAIDDIRLDEYMYINKVSASTLSYDATNILHSNSIYQFAVQGENIVGWGVYSDPTATIVTGWANLPSAPQNVAITVVNPGQVSLSWTNIDADDNGCPIFGWRVETKLSSAGDNDYLPVIESTYNVLQSSNIIVGGLLSSPVTYDFRVAAWNQQGLGAYSTTVTNIEITNTATIPPASLVRPTVQVTGSDTAVLSWSKPFDTIGATATAAHGVFNSNYLSGSELTGYQIEIKRHDVEVQTLNINTEAGFAAAGGKITVGSYALSLTYGSTLETTLTTNCLYWNAPAWKIETVLAKTMTTHEWTTCADQNAICDTATSSVSISSNVTWGKVSVRYVCVAVESSTGHLLFGNSIESDDHTSVGNTFACDAAKFGGSDPCPGQTKVCQILPISIHVSRTTSIDSWVSLASMSYDFIFVGVKGGNIPTMSISMTGGNNVACTSFVPSSTTVTMTANRNGTTGVKNTERSDTTFAAEYWHILVANTNNANVLSQQITNLLGYTTYEFRVRAINGVGVGEASEPSFVAGTQIPQAPALVDMNSVAVNNVASDKMNLTWTVPRHYGDLVTKYELRTQHYRNEMQSVFISSLNLGIVSGGYVLRHTYSNGTRQNSTCIDWNATAASISTVLQTSLAIVTRDASISFTTTNSTTQNYDIEFSNDNAPVGLLEPFENAGCTAFTLTDASSDVVLRATPLQTNVPMTALTNYDLNLSPLEQPYFILLNLLEKTSYRVAITTYNSLGTRGESSTSGWKTTAAATLPGIMVSTPQVDALSATTANVSFITPNMGGIPILGYTCVTVSGTLGPTVTPLNVSALIELPANQCQVTHIARPLGNELKIRPTARVYMTGLEKGTSYRFGVRAYNDVGFANEVGTMSVASSSVVTSTTVPSIPPGLPFTSKNSATYLTINFQTPIDDGGTAILGYRIYINVDGLTSDHVEYMSNTSDSFGASTSVLVLGLNASSFYTFQVAAINGVGVGPKSLSSDTKTTVLQYSMALYGTDNSTCGPSTTQQTLLENITATEILQHRNRSNVLIASFAEEIPRVPIQLTNAVGSIESNDAEHLIDGDNITSWSWLPAPSNVDGQNVTMAYVDFDAGSIVRIEKIAVWYGVRDKNSTTTFKFQSKEVPSGSWTDVPSSTKTVSSVVPVGATEVDPTASNKLDVVLSAVTRDRYWRLQVINITGLANYTSFAGVSLIPVPNCKGITRISGLYAYEAPLILDKVKTLINNGSYSTDLMAGGMTSIYSDTNVGYLSSVIERPLQTTPVADPEQPTQPYYTHISETYLVLGWVVPESGGTTIVGHSILSRMVQQPEVQRIQTVGASDGTFRLTYGTSETSCLPYNVDAPTMLTTLQTEIGALNASYNTNFTIDKTTESTTTTWQLEYGTDMMNTTLITATVCSGMTGAAAPTTFTVHDGKTLPFTVLQSNTNVQANSGDLGSYNATGLTKGIVYQFKVATIAFTQGPYSVPTEPQETVKTIPSSPTALVVSDSYTTFVVLNWTTPGDTGGRPVSGYVVEMATTVSGTTSAFSNFVADTGNTNTELLCSGLNASTTYVFRVAAINIMGIGSYSSSISIQTDAPSAPKPPVNIQIDSYYLGNSDNKYNYTVNVSWGTPLYTGGDSITGYKVEVRPVVPEQQIILARSTTSLDDPLGPVGGNGIGGGGQFKLSYDGQQANRCLDWNASAADVQTALESISSLMSLTNVNVQTMHHTNDGVHTMWTVTFLDVFYNLPLLEVSEGINTGPSCASGVDGTSATNTPCKFPFVYQGITYTDTCRNSGAGGSYNGQGWCPTSSTYPTAGYQWGSCISCTLDNCRAFGNEYTYTDLFNASNNIAGGSVPNIVVYEGLTGSGSTATVWTVEQLAATSSSTATSVMLPGLNFGNRYYARVSAINSIGISEPLTSSSYTAIEMSRPLSVDNSTFAVTHATSHMLEMIWNRPVQSKWGGSFVRGYAILVKGNSREDYNGSLHDSNWILNVKDTMYLGVGAGINSYDGAAATFEQKYQLTGLQAGVDYQLCAVVLSGNTDYNVPSSLAERCNPSEEFYTPLKIPDMPLSLEVLAGTATCNAASATMDLARCRTVQWQTPSSDGGKLIYEYRLYADVSREEMQSVTIILQEAETSSTKGQYKLTLEGVGTTQCLNYDADTATVVTAFANVGVTVVARDHDAGISINGGTEKKYFMNIVFTSNGANVVNGDVPLMTMAWGASGCATMTPSYSAIVEEQRKGLSLDGVYNLYATIPSNFTSSAPNVIVTYEGTFNLGQTYSLRMSAVTEMGESNMSTSATTFTTASATSSATPLQEIRDIQYTINTNSIVARWNVLDDGGYYITSYNLDSMIRIVAPGTAPPPVPTVLYLGPVPSSSSNGGSSSDQIQYEHNVTFSGLIIGESYEILIRAESVTGAVAAGTYSEPMRTALSVTDAPPNVPSFVVLSPTEGELSWEAPEFVGGSIVSGYQILCQIWFGNQQYIREVQQITSNGTSLTFLAGKVNQQYKIVHPIFNTHAESISTICFDPYATNATNLQTVLNTLGSVIRNGLDVVVSMSSTTNATTGAFLKIWSITFNQDLANRPLLTLTTVGCTTASSLASNETDLYGVDVAVDRTTSGVVSRSYNILLNDTSSVSTAFNITNLAKGTTHLFKVAAWNEYGLSPTSLPSEPKTSELIVKITLNGLTVATFDTAAQNSYLTVMSTITGHDVNNFIITNVQNVGSGGRRLMLEGSRNLLLATEDSTVVHSSRFLDGKINVEIQDLSGSVHLYPRRRRLNDAIEVTTVLNNVSVTQGYNAETSINVAVASVDPLTSLVLQLNNASVAVTTATIDSETIVEQAAPAEQPATVADTITANPITSNVAGSRITLSWTAPVDGGSAIVGYAVWYNATHKQIENTQSTLPTTIILSLLGETTYTFAVSAINGVGVSPASPFVSVTTFQQPALPVFRGCDSTCTAGPLSSTNCARYHGSTGSTLSTINLVTGDCAVLLSNTVDTDGVTPTAGTTSDTTFYYKIITDSTQWYTLPIEPASDATGEIIIDNGWTIYNAANGITLSSLGENMIHAISVRGGEFQSHSSLVVSLDVPYQQIASIEFQNPDRDTDNDISELSGNLRITQGGATASSTLYTAYWGSTKDTYLTNATGQKLSIFEINANRDQDTVEHTLAVNTLIPSGATHVLVAATNVLGENTTGATYLRIYDSTGTPGIVPSALALDVDVVDVDSARGTFQGQIHVYSAVDTTTVEFYNVYWGSSSAAKISEIVADVAVSSESVISLNVASTAIPSGASHVLVFTKNGAGEMTTGVSSRLLDSVPQNLYIIPHGVSVPVWLETNVNAVVCRVSVNYADLNLGYTNGMHDIDGQGNRVVHTPAINTGVQYPYYATDQYLLALGTALNLNVRFNKLKYISCVEAA